VDGILPFGLTEAWELVRFRRKGRRIIVWREREMSLTGSDENFRVT